MNHEAIVSFIDDHYFTSEQHRDLNIFDFVGDLGHVSAGAIGQQQFSGKITPMFPFGLYVGQDSNCFLRSGADVLCKARRASAGLSNIGRVLYYMIRIREQPTSGFF